MLQAAAAAAIKMPCINTLELWNGGNGLACLFRYQASEDYRPVTITWRGNWDLPLTHQVIQSWEAVALTYAQCDLLVFKELLDADVPIRSHGDAIQFLKPLQQVVHPVSLWQIRKENGH